VRWASARIQSFDVYWSASQEQREEEALATASDRILMELVTIRHEIRALEVSLAEIRALDQRPRLADQETRLRALEAHHVRIADAHERVRALEGWRMWVVGGLAGIAAATSIASVVVRMWGGR
jgi:predicted  nucleic acid-binding Zn-ribbon protein